MSEAASKQAAVPEKQTGVQISAGVQGSAAAGNAQAKTAQQAAVKSAAASVALKEKVQEVMANQADKEKTQVMAAGNNTQASAAKAAAAVKTPQAVQSSKDKSQAAAENQVAKEQVKPAAQTQAAAAGQGAETKAERSEITAQPTASPVQANSPAVVKVADVQAAEIAGAAVTASDAENFGCRTGSFGVWLSRIKSWWCRLSLGLKLYLVMVLLPSVLALGYFGLWASPMYVSEVKFAVKSAQSGANGLNLMSTIFKVPTSSLQDAMVVEEFLRSNDAFYAADGELGLIGHYSADSADLISRLERKPTIDEISSFWQSVTKVNVNQDSNVITFEVRAYSPEMARDINEQILSISENLVNSMNERAKEDMLKLADIEVAEARDRLTAAQEALRDFRNQNQDLDLKATAEGMQSLVIELESQAALLRTQIAEQSRYTDPGAPSLKALRDRLAGVEQQVERERSRLTQVASDGASLNTLASQYENLVTESEFARQQLVFAMTSLESAKADILAKNLYIVTVAKPSLPDESLYPRPFIFTFYIFVALSMAYAVVSLIGAAIKEHMGY